MKSIQRKMSMAFVPVMLFVAALIIFLAYLFTRQILSENAYKEARETASRHASEVSRRLEEPMDAARTMLKSVLMGNRDYLAVWTVYEPNALGQVNGKAQLTIASEDDAAHQDYYQVPFRTHMETALQPYLDNYSDNEAKILMTSCIVPVFDGAGTFLGVVGIDINLVTITAMIAAIYPYDTGYAFLIGNTGDVIAHPVTDRLAEGDLTQSLADTGRDEVGTLARAINNLTVRLNDIMRQITGAARQVADSSEQISSSAGTLAQGSHSQAATLEETSASIEELSVSVEQVAVSARTQESTVGQSLEGMQKLEGAMARVVGTLSSVAASGAEAMAKAKEGVDSVNRVVSVIQNIAESSEKIAGIVTVISDIADQTNLLALNAAIEAARAGENGRGFAVVADEVSKLADRSASSAKEIDSLITHSGRTVGSGVQIARDSLSAMDAIIEGSRKTSAMLEELGREIEQGVAATRGVSGALREISAISQSIAASTEEQSTGARQVSASIENMNALTQQASAAAEEMSASTAQLSELAQSLRDLVEHFTLAEEQDSKILPASKRVSPAVSLAARAS